ncbi:hypothetical protein FXO38_34286 [Capsicum annuum]|nr:hypothetical protein FXO38_34286 [Capsicum annuum]KAF3648746.1 hypothetical protein FXO37_19293 [Capsicum annuum]
MANNSSTPTDASGKKVRKPYTITKSRESWTEEEHDKFLEALQLFDRDWKKIEDFVGSKTVIQDSPMVHICALCFKSGKNSSSLWNESQSRGTDKSIFLCFLLDAQWSLKMFLFKVDLLLVRSVPKPWLLWSWVQALETVSGRNARIIFGTTTMEPEASNAQTMDNNAINLILARLKTMSRDVVRLNVGLEKLDTNVALMSGRLERVEKQMSRPSTPQNNSPTNTPETLHQMLYPPIATNPTNLYSRSGE